MGKFFKKWEEGLGKTRRGIRGNISRIFRDRIHGEASVLEEIEQILIESDMGVETAMDIVEEARETLNEKERSVESQLHAFLKNKVRDMLRARIEKECFSFKEKPHVILIVGVNGTGKTTTIGKMANRYRREGRKVLLACADTFRAAAGEQLEVWGKRVGVEIVRQSQGADPASVAFDGLEAAIARGVDLLIIDTAGRLHTKVNLMEELKKIRRVLSKKMENAPHEVIMVLDATVGQNGLVQAKRFTDAVGVTGIALTKLDGTARGGIVVAIQKTLGIPVKWVGVGEGMDDLLTFDAEAFVEGMFG